jgi:hypothetical protein
MVDLMDLLGIKAFLLGIKAFLPDDNKILLGLVDHNKILLGLVDHNKILLDLVDLVESNKILLQKLNVLIVAR